MAAGYTDHAAALVREYGDAELEAARHGPFVVANGSPLAPGTPPANNAEAMIRAARRYGRYPL